jgi:putative DNA primase/helicase
MAQAGQTQKGGQEVRSPDIPAIPEGAEYGCFERIHGAADAVQFVSGLEAAVRANHGTAMDAYLSRLVVDAADQKQTGQWSKQTHLIAAKLSEGFKDTAIGRVANRFALVQVALGVAHQYGLLPFPAEDIDWAIALCFKDWVKGRGGDGSVEVKRAIDRIEHLLVSNELGDRVFTLPDNNGQKVRTLLAYRRLDVEGNTDVLLVPPSIFTKEFCAGVNKTELITELRSRGLLPEADSEGRPDHQAKVNGKKGRFYILSMNGIHEKSLGTLGTLGTASSNPDLEQVVATPNSTQNTKTHLGTLGTFGPESGEGTQGTQAENEVWVPSGRAESPTGQGIEGMVPKVPKVPTQKTDIPTNLQDSQKKQAPLEEV